MKIAIACDHTGPELKNYIIQKLGDKYEFINCGTDTEESIDYPDYSKKATDLILNKEVDCAVLICGTGIGMSIAANKVRGIRAGLCHNPVEARLTKEHNNANVICLGARMIGKDLAVENVKAYLEATFQGGRHQNRINKLE
mgnify:CR=1 FL=1